LVIFAVPLMEAGPGLAEVMKLSECDFIKYCIQRHFNPKSIRNLLMKFGISVI